MHTQIGQVAYSPTGGAEKDNTGSRIMTCMRDSNPDFKAWKENVLTTMLIRRADKGLVFHAGIKVSSINLKLLIVTGRMSEA